MGLRLLPDVETLGGLSEDDAEDVGSNFRGTNLSILREKSSNWDLVMVRLDQEEALAVLATVGAPSSATLSSSTSLISAKVTGWVR